METITAAQIHKEFYAALDVATISVKEVKSSIDEEYFSNLDKFGLINTETYKKALEKKNDDDQQRLDQKINEFVLGIQGIMPEYRLIGYKSLLEICEKYNLYIGNITKFEGKFPKENLEELANHKKILQGMGKKWNHAFGSYTSHDNEEITPDIKHLRTIFPTGVTHQHILASADISEFYEKHSDNDKVFYTNAPYQIVAPRGDFNKSMVEVGRCLMDNLGTKPKFELKYQPIKFILEDPIVLYPVLFLGTLFFQIVTAWGEEANDDAIVNKVNVSQIMGNNN